MPATQSSECVCAHTYTPKMRLPWKQAFCVETRHQSKKGSSIIGCRADEAEIAEINESVTRYEKL